MDQKNITTFQKNDVIIRQGDLEFFMYEILSGRVGVYINYGKDNEEKLTELEEGNFVGELGLLGEEGSVYASPRSATVVAAADNTAVLKIGVTDFNDYFRENPEKIFRMMQQMSKRLKDITNDYAEACDTIRGMKETEGEIRTDRKESLLERIAKYSTIYPMVWY